MWNLARLTINVNSQKTASTQKITSVHAHLPVMAGHLPRSSSSPFRLFPGPPTRLKFRLNIRTQEHGALCQEKIDDSKKRQLHETQRKNF